MERSKTCWGPALLLAGTLSAWAQPVIDVHPQPQAVPPGGTTTFWVRAGGTAPLIYQWFFNTVANPIPGATNATLVIREADPADEGNYRVRVTDSEGFIWSGTAALTLLARGLPAFGTIDLPPAFVLDGVGTDVDSIAIWETPEPTNTVLFVTAKGNDRLEVWRHPFLNNQLPARLFPANINGVAVDQDTDLLYVADQIVSVLALPGLELVDSFGQGIIGVGENNLDLLRHTNGQTVIYVSDDHNVHRFVAGTFEHLGAFAPPVVSIETILADDYHQMILVPEEQGAAGNAGVYAYHPDGTPYLRAGTNVFGDQGVFDSDEEGILLYTFPTDGLTDNGAGFIVVADQRSDQTDFEFFDRESWAHLGRLRVAGVSNTDGIASTQWPMPGYPLGLFAAIDNDTSTVGLGWDAIFQAMGVGFGPRAIAITPSTTAPAGADSVTFEVAFSRAVSGFNDAADVDLIHFGTAHAGVAVTGAGADYSVEVSGLGGAGFLLMTLRTNSDVADLEGRALVSSVTSEPVFLGATPYQMWASSRGLASGVNDGFGDDPDGDARSNIGEFATDGDPLDAADDGKRRARIEEVTGTNAFTYTFPVRSGAVFVQGDGLSATMDGVVYAVDGSLDLVGFGEPMSEVTPARVEGMPGLNSGWDYRTFRLDRAVEDAPAGFIRLAVGGGL